MFPEGNPPSANMPTHLFPAADTPNELILAAVAADCESLENVYLFLVVPAPGLAPIAVPPNWNIPNVASDNKGIILGLDGEDALAPAAFLAITLNVNDDPQVGIPVTDIEGAEPHAEYPPGLDTAV